jgi:hypothetical protein
MKYLVYISTAYKLLTQDELLDILAVSRKNNERRNLTGMLLYGEGTFIQVLEGDIDQLNETYAVIKADPRHKNILKMTEGEITQRNFPEWLMGFKSVNARELEEFGSYIDPANLNHVSEDNSNMLISMMKTFADANRMTY